jgi:hypothetical protein
MLLDSANVIHIFAAFFKVFGTSATSKPLVSLDVTIFFFF